MLHLTKAEEEKEETFRDKESGADLEVQEKQSLLEWLANNYKKVWRRPCHAASTSRLAQHEADMQLRLPQRVSCSPGTPC